MAKKSVGVPGTAKWLRGRRVPFSPPNPFKKAGEIEEVLQQARRAAQATDAARQERQASLGRDASHDDE